MRLLHVGKCEFCDHTRKVIEFETRPRSDYPDTITVCEECLKEGLEKINDTNK